MRRISFSILMALCLHFGVWAATTPPLVPPTPLVSPAPTTPALPVKTEPASPFEDDHWSTPANSVDTVAALTLRKHGAALRPPCSDAVFIRRVYIDSTGTMPAPSQLDAFLADPRPDKRAALIDTLLSSDEFADYWALNWCDTLRVKSEYPINLWPNAAQAYHHWVRTAIKENMPYDQFARALLTSNGSNFYDPQVNFYRAVQSHTPATIAAAVALTFMGTRFEKWPQARRDNMADFFSRIAYKGTDEWKEEIVYPDPQPAAAVKTAFPDGTAVTIPADGDPRVLFTDWLLAPNNPWFARNLVNRLWAWTMGHGIIDAADDIRPDNPPASPEVLACLERELVQSHYDQRQVFRLIFNSRIYQQSSLPHGDTTDPALQFAHYTIRRQYAEVLIDALCHLGGDGEEYISETPEPFTFIPKQQHTVALADGSITSAFLITFGRPARDTGLMAERDSHPSDTQRLYLLNSADVQRRISRGPLIQHIPVAAHGNRAEVIRNLYALILSRYPTASEAVAADHYFQTGGLTIVQGTNDLAWALINSKEFLYRH